MRKLYLLGFFLLSCQYLTGQIQENKKLIDTLTYETQSGLPIAASKIYFSDAKFTFSGFGETNYINYLGPKNRESGDLELYNTNLQRFVAYAAYKPKKWLVLYAELFAEYANDGTNEGHFEYLPELFVDFLINEKFNVRVGSHQPQIGYINNNDEPVMFHSVNRPEVERLIIPSQWIDMGIMTYGKINSNLKWSLSVYQGLEPHYLNGATWIRRGRDETLRFNFNSFILNGGIKYTGLKNTELAVNGIFTQLGNNELVETQNNKSKVASNTYLLSSYIKHDFRNFSFMALGTYGRMNETEKIFELTKQYNNGIGQVMGEEVYGYYTEVAYDILPLLGLNKRKEKGKADNFLVKSKELKLPIFARYERLNTHNSISPLLSDENRFQSDLTVLTVGANFNPRRSIVLKANYQFRLNKEPMLNGEFEGDRFELGMGFIF